MMSSCDLSRRARRDGALPRVLVVDDSAFMRRLVSDLLIASGEFDVIGTARDGRDALQQVACLHPDLITLDMDMPVMGGLECLDRIMRDHPRPVVMLSAGGQDGGAEATLHALERGAVDFVRKPSGAISLDLDAVRDQLLEALRAAAAVVDVRLPTITAAARGLKGACETLERNASVQRVAPDVLICIAASTGGPAALAQIVPQLPRFQKAAVLIVQHMPAGFTASLAKRLHGISRLAVHEARHGEPIFAGHVYIAPGGYHLRVGGPRNAPVVELDHSAPMWGVRPAADRLFVSAAAAFGQDCCGVVLTGMGRDGADGLLAIRQCGGFAVVQDQASCIVSGMPDAARRVAGADLIGALPEMAGMIAQHALRHASGGAAVASALQHGVPV